MNNRNGLFRFIALVLILMCFMPALSQGDEGNGSGAGHSSDLANFLDRIEIAGAELDAEGRYVIVQGVPYTIQMYFSEKSDSWQFSDDPQSPGLVYEFPNGFTPSDSHGTFEMTGDGGVMRVNYVISSNTMTVTFDQSSPGYESFISSETAWFEVHATGIISEEELVFSSEVTGSFSIDDMRKVQVEKTGSYDEALNKIRYTIQARSTGNNTDVHIGDLISGTALTYDPTSLTVVSDVSNPVIYNPDTQTGETFGLTIPSMVHGETVTIEYCADINLSGLTSTGNKKYGTVEETGNAVRITSHEDPEGHENTEDFQNRISLSTNSKTAASQTIRDGKTYITWNLILNENANISIAGKSVTDTIDASSQELMRYSGSGIHIDRYLKDGTPAGSSDVRWGINGLSASKGGSTWTYTIPESDAGLQYRYVISYETEVDTDILLTPSTVINTTENEYDSDQAAVSVEPTGEEVEAEKTAVQSNVNIEAKEAETEWMITFSVPSSGLDSAVIVDSLPGFLNYAEMQWYYDVYQEGSAHVGDGDLLEGERFTVEASPQDHQVKVSFFKSNGEPGLAGTGLPRTIHVYLTTEASHDWLVYAESLSRARTHTNNAVVRVNGQDINVTGSVAYSTTAYELEKIQIDTYSTNTDPPLPIYAYRLILSNVNDAVFDENGCFTIHDTYNADYLSFSRSYQTDNGYEINLPNGYVYGNTQWRKYELVTKGTYVVDDASSEGELVFRLNKNDLPMNGTSYYPYYAIAYALQIKDAETLARMKDEALHTEGLTVKLENTAGNDQFGSNTLVTEYTVKALEKKLLSEDDNESTGTHDLHFSIAVNEQGLKIGEQDMLTLKDTLSNLSFDYTSIEIEPKLEGDTLNRSGNSIIFTLHNETPYTITYTARLVGIHDVQWHNKAELYGFVSGLNGTSSSESGGSGAYKVYSMNVKKYAEGNMNHGLAATFELYEARVKDASGNDIAQPQWVKVGEFVTDDATGLYQIRTVVHEGTSEARSLRPYSFHNENREEQFGVDYGWRYRIKETIAPEGYQKTTVLYEFGISDIPSYIAPYNYLNNDTVTIVNKPLELTVDTVITGEKILVGKKLDNQEFAFLLRPEPGKNAAWGDGYPGGFSGSLTALNDEAGRFSFTLTFTYEDYLNAVDKGFADENQRASFYYVITEKQPDGAEGNFFGGVLYDSSQYLVRVDLFIVGDELRTETFTYPYDRRDPLITARSE